MGFRPCIDIHNGKVKQIVGASLKDQGDYASENFVASKDAVYYAGLYREAGLKGGHVILLNGRDSDYYEATKRQAFAALSAYPGGLQAGGGITAGNAAEFLQAGASHVIVTSYVFRDGKIRYDRLEVLAGSVGREHVVLDLSCRKIDGEYLIMTDRWQNRTREAVTTKLMDRLSEYCDEFLIHAVDVEGKAGGIETELVGMLGEWDGCPVTYAGGIRSLDDIRLLTRLSGGKMHYTIGSSLDIFGGTLSFREVCELQKMDSLS